MRWRLRRIASRSPVDEFGGRRPQPLGIVGVDGVSRHPAASSEGSRPLEDDGRFGVVLEISTAHPRDESPSYVVGAPLVGEVPFT
jgi:hypothetical protein